MVFDEFDYDDKLTSLPAGYAWEISINMETSTVTGVGTEYSSWDSWSGS